LCRKLIFAIKPFAQMEITIRTLTENDFDAVKKIYQDGMDTKQATFETAAPEWEEWNVKFLKENRLVAVAENEIAGWAALSAVSARTVYSGVCEVSVYVCIKRQGRGVGKKLLATLIQQSEESGIWTLQAGIFPENSSSVALHKQLGFREVGYRERIGKREGVWRDTILLERRSKSVGPN
jgi:L-amino acid N-acyltransferase YncA